jgi:D-serine deaminase-like pyridoxal phosphate-dependent protein
VAPFDDVTTPTLVVDLTVLERNLASMAAEARGRSVALRPHAKTHKSVEVARRQLALGAAGLSVATVGEAEVFAGAGVDDLFIAYPVWADRDRAARLGALAERTRLRVGVDSAEGATALGRARVGGANIEALVEVDSGHHRSGCRPEEAAVVARAAEQAGLRVCGVFTFPGHAYAPEAAAGAADDEGRALEAAGAALEAAGLDAPVRSGGSTPTARRTSPRVTELRPGVYAFNDAQQVALGTCGPADVALFAVATVVSAPAPGRIVLDSGSKILGADRPDWLEGHGIIPSLPGAVVISLSEHHAVVELGAGNDAPPEVGRHLTVVPNHVCNAVNLVDEVLAVRDGMVVATWPVDARGALA